VSLLNVAVVLAVIAWERHMNATRQGAAVQADEGLMDRDILDLHVNPLAKPAEEPSVRTLGPGGTSRNSLRFDNPARDSVRSSTPEDRASTRSELAERLSTADRESAAHRDAASLQRHDEEWGDGVWAGPPLTLAEVDDLFDPDDDGISRALSRDETITVLLEKLEVGGKLLPDEAGADTVLKEIAVDREAVTKDEFSRWLLTHNARSAVKTSPPTGAGENAKAKAMYGEPHVLPPVPWPCADAHRGLAACLLRRAHSRPRSALARIFTSSSFSRCALNHFLPPLLHHTPL
jgi:hypothetical protein